MVLAAGSTEVIARKAIQVKRRNRAPEKMITFIVRSSFRRNFTVTVDATTMFNNRRATQRRQVIRWAITNEAQKA